MKKRLICLVTSAAMILSFMAGCENSKIESVDTSVASSAAADSKDTTASEPEPVTITVGNWPKETDEALTKTYNGYVETLKEKYPYITIKSDQWTYDVNSFLPKAASGQLPKLYSTWFTETEKIIDAGYACDITDTFKKYSYDQAINKDMLKLVEQDGKYYGIPQTGYVMGMLYNVNLFKKAGLVDEKGIPKFPKTFDELAQTAKTIKDKTGKAGFFFPGKNNQGGWMFMNIGWAFGAEFEKKVDGKWKAVFNSAEGTAALQYIKDLKWKYDVLNSNILTDANEMFKLIGTDQVGMSIGASDWMNIPVNDYKMSKDNLAMSALPAGPSGNSVLMGGSLYMLSPDATAEQQDAAIKWLEVSGTSPKTDEASLKGIEDLCKIDKESNRIVGPHGLLVWTNEERVQAENSIRDKYKTVDMNLWNDYINNGANGMRPEEPVNCQELYKALDNAIQSVVTDKNADPKSILDKIAADFQRNYLDKAQ